ncbi:MAG: phage head closure protein [Candidatus Improbicoccus pseudotrichonymphae]|uniref:Phage head closure protein n=1 Tax=Candidatus Improbicoccus pseudotrichonymphae TaxID=3033792 RepID=A0AA48I0T6_9FIRM|nr:MAG: phage head closure protein [Candidatus Improbicoccus pseudotrichonymphae]BED92031.1 MAG: phage head closure protein [Candidatus Improbicoccus pseudotrichonymphae]
MYINIGNLNKKIQVISYIITKDENGFPIKTENIELDTWAQVTNTSGTEMQRSNSDFSETKTRFLIRTPNQRTPNQRTPNQSILTINKDMVIKFRNQIFEIIYINDYSYDKDFTEIMTKLVIK